MRTWAILIAVVGLLALLPFAGNNYFLRLATTVCMFAVMAQSWNFIGGLAGYPSFATAAFFGLGAYVSAILQSQGMPILLSWGCAGLAATAFAAFIGGAILHLRGHYFAIASLIVTEMLRELINGMPDLTGGGGYQQLGEVFDVPVTITLQYADGSSEDAVVAFTEASGTAIVPARGPVRGIDVNKDDAALGTFDRR
jgi:ABC-type branched-subunit amino acid transport system permease subunit